MSYALERRAVTAAPALAAALCETYSDGSVQALELHELTYGEVTDLMRAPATEALPLAMLGAALRVGGQAVGVEGLRSLPARCVHEINELMAQVLELHGFDSMSKAPPQATGNGHDRSAGALGAGTPGEVQARP